MGRAPHRQREHGAGASFDVHRAGARPARLRPWWRSAERVRSTPASSRGRSGSHGSSSRGARGSRPPSGCSRRSGTSPSPSPATVGLDGPEAASELAGLFAGLEARARELIGGSGDRPIAWQRHAHLRYAGQGFELRVAIPDGPIDGEFPARAREAFDSRYEAEYGYAQRDEPAEGTDWFLTGGPGGDPAPAPASGSTGGSGRDPRADREDADADPLTHPHPDPPRSEAAGEGGRAGGSARPAPIGTVTAWLADAPAGSGGAWADWPVFDRDGLRTGDRLAGPAIVAERESTTLLPAGDTARVSGEGNLLIDVSAREGSTPP